VNWSPAVYRQTQHSKNQSGTMGHCSRASEIHQGTVGDEVGYTLTACWICKYVCSVLSDSSWFPRHSETDLQVCHFQSGCKITKTRRLISLSKSLVAVFLIYIFITFFSWWATVSLPVVEHFLSEFREWLRLVNLGVLLYLLFYVVKI
jgi:hypothetical protein